MNDNHTNEPPLTDAELDTEIRRGMIQLSDSAPTAPSASELGLDGSVPVYTTNSTSNVESLDSRRNSRRRMFGGLAAAAALTAGGVVTLNAASDGGGAEASTPTAAVEQLIDAIADEDVIGVLEAMDPGERDMLQSTFTDVISELDRLEILNGANLGGLQGFELEVEGLQLVSRPLTNDIHAVTITGGTFTSTTDPTLIPLGDGVVRAADGYSDLQGDLAATAAEFDNAVADVQSILDEADFEFVVTNDDGWTVDLDHTLWLQVSKDQGWAEGDYAAGGLVPTGAESPEAVALAFMQAHSRFDIAGMLDLADPVELDGTLLYGSDLARAIGADIDEDFIGSFTTSDMAVDGEGSRRTVRIASFEAAFGDGTEANSFSYAFDGRCLTFVAGEDSPESMCTGDADLPSYQADTLAGLAMNLNVVEREGRWYVSALGTIRDSWVANLAIVDRVDDENDAFALTSTVLNVPILPTFGPGRVFLLGFETGDGTMMSEPTDSSVYTEAERPFAECYDSAYGPGLEETAEQATLAGQELGKCLTAAGADPEEIKFSSGYRACERVTNDLYRSGQEPTPEDQAAAYQQQADCLAPFGITDSYTPTANEIRAERECNKLYDEGAEATAGEEPDWDALDEAYSECMEELHDK